MRLAGPNSILYFQWEEELKPSGANYSIYWPETLKKSWLPGTVFFDDLDITTNEKAQSFTYFCLPDELPEDIKVKKFVLFIGRLLKQSRQELSDFEKNLRDKLKKNYDRTINDLVLEEKGYLLLETASVVKSQIFLFYQFAQGMPAHFLQEFKERINKIKDERKIAIFYLTNNLFTGKKLADMVFAHKNDQAHLNVSL